jgi:hypothetical protein
MIESVANRSSALATSSVGTSNSTTVARNNSDAVPARESLNWAQPQQAQPLSQTAAPQLIARANGGLPRPTNTELAELASNVYGNDRPPAGFRVANLTERQLLGIPEAMLNPGGGSEFRAEIYVREVNGRDQYVVAMRGTRATNITDWGTNTQQASGQRSDHYNRALEIGRSLARRPELNVTITGHSLGGGLAATAAIASGHDAVTFNAAGLHRNTIALGDAIRGGERGVSFRGSVTAFNVRGEGLSGLQDAARALPDAYGNRVKLDARAPAGSTNNNPIARHGMDWVLASLAGTVHE